MKVTVANSFHVAGSLALPVGLGSHADESLVVGPFEWAHDMHARFGRLLAARAVGVDPQHRHQETRTPGRRA